MHLLLRVVRTLLGLGTGLGLGGVAALAFDVQNSLPDFGSLLAGATTLTVYEGLPHPVWEKRTFAEERRTKTNFELGREFFYAKPLAVSAADRQGLDHLFRTTTVCVPFRGEKLCGGFHADYLVEWRQGETHVASALLCFGCHELKLIAPGREFRADLSEGGFTALRAILSAYRQERPPFKPDANEKKPKPSPPRVEVKL